MQNLRTARSDTAHELNNNPINAGDAARAERACEKKLASFDKKVAKAEVAAARAEGWLPYSATLMKRVNKNTNRYEYLTITPAPAPTVSSDGWQRFDNHADRAMTDLMTGKVDELSVIKENHGWRGEYNICGAADAIDIDEVDNAKNMEQAIAAADLWLRGYTGGES